MEIDFKDPKYYTNRELSWVLFDYRVLNEARDKSIPLFERLKFLSITASNLDEFFMIRVASLKDMENAGYTKKDFNKNYVNKEIFPREIGRKISRLEVIRHKSDYDTFYIASREDALEQIDVAKEVVELVKDYLVQKGLF